MTTQTQGQRIAADIASLFRARNPLIWISSREESRVESLLYEAAASAKYRTLFWDCASGLTLANGLPVGDVEIQGGGDANNPLDIFATIRQASISGMPMRTVWVMRDLPVWLRDLSGAMTLRGLRSLTRYLPSVDRARGQCVVVLAPQAEIPPELATTAAAVNWPLPDRAEIGAVLDAQLARLPDTMKADAAPNGTRDAAIDAAVGLSGDEAASCFSKSLVATQRIDPATVAGEKKRIVAQSGGLQWFDPLPGGLDSVGGLELLKDWLIKRKAAFGPKARAFGLPAPKGIILAGIPGCGKSLSAKAIATAWNCPLLWADLSGLKSKYVGSSEANLRAMLQTVDAVGRCVLVIDEIEKSLAGATQGGADGGVSSDALGTLLSWMQERKGESFVIATSNDIDKLPPELLRKGRFDDLFFVDTPNTSERNDILCVSIKPHVAQFEDGDLSDVIIATQGFTGSEIAQLVSDALFTAFDDKMRQFTPADLLAAARATVPLTKTMGAKLDAMRARAKGFMRPASKPETMTQESTLQGRQIDI